jgi:hypothetical protein
MQAITRIGRVNESIAQIEGAWHCTEPVARGNESATWNGIADVRFVGASGWPNGGPPAATTDKTEHFSFIVCGDQQAPRRRLSRFA